MTTSIRIHRGLTVDLFQIKEAGQITELSFRLSRLQAQKLAETLRAFATGTSTKEVGTATSALFLAEDVKPLSAKSASASQAASALKAQSPQPAPAFVMPVDHVGHLR